jgi:hypothetical protein
MVGLGLVEDVAKPAESVVEQVGVILTPRSAKLLAHILTATISNWEKANGREFPLDQKKLDEIADLIAKGTSRRSEKKE